MQDVPEWLEEVASGAVGSNYGPQGGSGFASRDTRVSMMTRGIYSKILLPSKSVLYIVWHHCYSNNFVEAVVVVAVVVEAAVDLVAVMGLGETRRAAALAVGALAAHHLVARQQMTKKNGIKDSNGCFKQSDHIPLF